MTTGILLIAVFILSYSMVANRLAGTILTAPMLFLTFGYLISTSGLLPEADIDEALSIVAEVTLVILLFLDAAQINFKALRKRFVWPARMLLLGIPLSILIGTFFGWLFLPGWPLVAIALVASVLAPTDAALGQAVVSNKLVPERVRRTVTVESGLNDGLALPVILLFASLTAAVGEGVEGEVNWLVFGAEQIILGPIAGIIIGTSAGYILLWAKAHNTTAVIYEGVGALALALACYLFAEVIGGNGFIAAFVGGLCFGAIVKDKCGFIFEFTESEGQGLIWMAFFLIGLALLPEASEHLDWATFGIIMTSLFIVRPLAIWISLMGTDASAPTRLFLGWFGPRGLATALFALTVVDSIDVVYGDAILNLAVNAVWISALLHGVSAAPYAKWYANLMSCMAEEDPEMAEQKMVSQERM